MHSFFHEETGVTINHNSDNSGDAFVTVPGKPDIEFGHYEGGQYWSVRIPAAALAAFSRVETISEMMNKLEEEL